MTSIFRQSKHGKTARFPIIQQSLVAYVEHRWAIRFSIPGMNKWLHRDGFSYKKPAGVPHKFSEENKKHFIEYYENLKKTAGNEPILFIDAVHPTQATKLSYKWIRKGHKKSVKTKGSRTRLNILGALNLSDIGGTVIHDYKTINDYNIARFFIEIRKRYPDYRQRIHVILDGVGYHQTQLIKDWAFVVNIELH